MAASVMPPASWTRYWRMNSSGPAPEGSSLVRWPRSRLPRMPSDRAAMPRTKPDRPVAPGPPPCGRRREGGSLAGLADEDLPAVGVVALTRGGGVSHV
ncbi:hypothetical protein ADL02_12115 [Streptomyces sp. NRRL WC-3723]|nr:hypothetical protein ADL02_12115 [Streptomyces sp. NRRL WC-3723]